MAALVCPPPRTPSPKVKIHRSQSFDSPSSRISVTPIDESPYSKSASFIPTYAHPLPRYDILKGTHDGATLSDDEAMSDASSEEGYSNASDSSENWFGLFESGSPPPRYTSPLLPPPSRSNNPIRTHSRNNSIHAHHAHYEQIPSSPQPSSPLQILSSSPPLSIYQDTSTPSYDPWLVRIVLDLFDVRGYDWMDMAEVITRFWGRRTGSAEVLEILRGNGRVNTGVWWD
jgi:hypothetical protein